jgi:hypothetical protein
MNNNILKVAAVSFLFWSLGAQAQIVYHLDRTIGSGTVKGTIETDGTIGPLTPSNILSWSLEADDGSGEHSPITIGSNSGGGLTGAGWDYFSATESELRFDFDGAYASGFFADVQFFGGGTGFSVNYGFAAASNFPYGKKENLVHFFDDPIPGQTHYVESLRDGVMIVGAIEDLSVYCSGPSVSMGEVMAGLQAGLTGGAHTETGAPEDFFGAVNFEERRGFIIPENGIASVQCNNDHILIGEWFAASLDRFDTIKEAKDWATSLFGGRYAEIYFEIDGSRVDHLQTGTKIGTLPWGPRVAFFNAGYVIEPYSLLPGPHTATFVLVRDPGSDGEPPFIDIRLAADFTIVDSAAP